MAQQQRPHHWTPAWVALVTALTAAAVVLAEQAHVLPLDWWGFPIFGVFGAGVTVFVVLAQNGSGWPRSRMLAVARALAYRATVWMSAGAWTAWAILDGWTHPVWLALITGTGSLAGLAYVCQVPESEYQAATGARLVDEQSDRRPPRVVGWERLLRRLTKAQVTVTQVVPWDNPRDGERVFVDLPLDGNVTAQKLIDVLPNIGVAMQLKPGCTVHVDDGEHQGAIVLDVMLRDCLADGGAVLDDDFTPASINDDVQVMSTPRGEGLDICLRSQSMVIGGAPESGKTTLLHRIILWLARCIDCVIWVVDTNGGGVATPWLRAWAMGKAKRPVIDWVAADDEEAAVLVAVARAIAKDRKVSPEAVRRKHQQDTMILPVDEQLPAIIVINDEGGEMKQAASILAQLADQGISRLVQIGRAEAVRAIKSVLRGTADLLDKGMRVNAALRLCLRMEEEDEYPHVLGKNPGKTALLHKGSGYLKRPGDPRPIFGRTVNMLLSQIERASIACADLRPDLDERARKVASKVRPRDVLDGRDPESYPDIMALPIMRDVEAGLAYARRWERFAPRLAAIRGEELPEAADVDEPAAARPAGPPLGGALAALAAGAGVTPATPTAAPAADADQPGPRRVKLDKGAVDREAERLLSQVDWTPKPQHAVGQTVTDQQPAKLTTRQRVVAILREEYPAVLTPAQIGAKLDEADAGVKRTYLQDLLKAMVIAGEIVRPEDGQYTLDLEK